MIAPAEPTPKPRHPTVSVIVPSHGRAGMLERAVISVVEQSYPAAEVIVVDDASPEPLEGAVAPFDVHYIRRDQRGGPSAARNSGLEVATGDLIAFLDSDDEWAPRKLECQVRHWQANAAVEPALTFCGFEIDTPWLRRTAVPGNAVAYEAAALLGVASTPLTASVLLANGDLLRRRHIRFDETMPALEDLDFVVQLAGEGPVLGQREVLVRKHRSRQREHAYTVESDLAGRTLLATKYRDILATDPQARAAFTIRLALSHVRAGDPEGARRQLAAIDGSKRAATLRSVLTGLLRVGHAPFSLAARALLTSRRRYAARRGHQASAAGPPAPVAR